MEGYQMGVNQGGDDDGDLLYLPPGFRFHPTDEEIITHYLAKKVVDDRFTACAMGEADLNKCEPWDLPERAKMGEKEWYFFVQKDRKYPTGMRTNRATGCGYWKATGKDKVISRGKSCLVGMKKTLVFYKGRAPKGEKTNWVMHEFRLVGELADYHLSKPSKDEWVVCKVFHKSTGMRNNPIFRDDVPRNNSADQDCLPDSIPPLVEPSNYCSGQQSSGFTHGEEDHGRFDSNCGGNDPFTPQFPKYEHPSSLFPSYVPGPHNSDYFVDYGDAHNHHHKAIIRGLAAEKTLKPEQFSSIVSPSRGTVAGADAHGEVPSSAVSGNQHQARGHYVYHYDPERPSVDPISDFLEYSWD